MGGRGGTLPQTLLWNLLTPKIMLDALQNLVDQKYLRVQKHPTEDLWIYNYTEKCQYDQHWTPETLMCRGLILDSNGDIKARPFKKFFNMGEHEGQLPDGEVTVWEKYDGSLGILYWIGDTPFLATRGSFESDQAIRGTAILHNDEHRLYWDWLDRSKTYLFEIIYPDNRIVVDYGEDEKIVHLATIDIETGKDCGIEGTPFTHALSYSYPIHKLPKRENAEGFVLQWENGFRLKVKHEEYVRLHRLVTQVTARSIWDLLRNNESFDELLERVPDEFYKWVKATKKELEDAFQEIKTEAQALHKQAKKLKTRKEQALFLQSHKHKALVFRLLDGKDIKQDIWKLLYPPHITPFKNEESNNS